VEINEVFCLVTKSYTTISPPAANIIFDLLAATAICVMGEVQVKKLVALRGNDVATRMSML
jgi:hypothetical protein